MTEKNFLTKKQRFRLIAVIDRKGNVHEIEQEGTSSLQDIFRSNKNDMCFAVVELDGLFIAMDLWAGWAREDEYRRDKWKIFKTADAAIVAAVLMSSGND